MGVLIGISGVAGSGKDTTANFLVDEFNFLSISFADPLKRICGDVFDWDENALWGPSEERNKPDKRYLRPAGCIYPFTPRGSVWIPLSKGEHALIDEADFNRVVAAGPWWVVEKEKGKRTKYAKASIPGRADVQREIKLHQFITGDSDIDHINGNGLDNRRINLRKANNSQNHANTLPQLGGSSPFKGVTFDKSRKKWSAKITVDYKTINLGRFWDEYEAAAAYDKAAKEYFGEYARTNLDCFLTPRHALQQLGTEFGRNCYQNVWVEYGIRTAKKILDDPYGYNYTKAGGLGKASLTIPIGGVAIPDCRFFNEIKLMQEAGAILIRIKRPGAGLKGEAAKHASEAEQLSIPDSEFDYVVENNGTLDDLKVRVFEIGNELGLLRVEEKQLSLPWI